MDVIGRINGANPAEGEIYYLRLLLNHVRGPTLFADMLTVNGTRYSTFKESTVKRGLLESDHSITECLDEVTSFQMLCALHRLFATILVCCEPIDVKKQWDDYFEDFEIEEESSQTHKITKTLKSLNFFLESMGKSIKSYDLPALPQDFVDDRNPYSRELKDEMYVEIPLEDYSA